MLGGDLDEVGKQKCDNVGVSSNTGPFEYPTQGT